MSLRKKFLFALEDETTVVEPEVTPEADNLEIVENEAEVAEATTALEDHLEVLDESVDDIEEMQQVGDVLERTVESGEGATEETAELAEVAIERICSRLNLRGKSFVSLESFGSKNTRLSATKIAVEDIGDKIAAAWAAVKAFFKKVYEKIIDFFKKIWASLVSFKNKAKELMSNVAKATFKSGEYMMPKGYKASDVAKVLKDLKGEATNATDEAKAAAKLIEALEKAASKGDAQAVDTMIQENSEGMAVATEAAVVGKKDNRQKVQQQADALIADVKNQEKQELSETEAKNQTTETAKAFSETVSSMPTESEAQAAIDAVNSANLHLANTAETDSKKAAEAISSNKSSEETETAKKKLEIWNKVKAFSTKLYSYISAAVTGIYRRITALLTFTYKFVIFSVKVGAGMVLAAGKGLAKAVMHGKADKY